MGITDSYGFDDVAGAYPATLPSEYLSEGECGEYHASDGESYDMGFNEFADAYIDDADNDFSDTYYADDTTDSFSDVIAYDIDIEDNGAFGINADDPLAEFYPGAHRNAVTEYDDEATEEELAEESKFSDINWRVDQSAIDAEKIVLDNGLSLQDEDFLPLLDEEEREVAEKLRDGEYVNLGREIPVIYCIDGGAGIFAGETKVVGPLECELPDAPKKKDDDEDEEGERDNNDMASDAKPSDVTENSNESADTVSEDESRSDIPVDPDDSDIAISESDDDGFSEIEGADEIGVESASKSKGKKTKKTSKKLTKDEKDKSKKFGIERMEGHVITKVDSEGTLTSDKAKSKFKKVKGSRLMFEGDRASIKKRFFASNLRDYMIYIACLAVIAGCGWFAYDYFNQNASADSEFSGVGETYTMPEMKDVASQEPDTATSWPPIVDWAALKAQYPDVAAWLRIPGTSVDYPVLTNEVPDYYLHRSMSGAYSMPGSIFADFENTNDLSQQHIVLYGHHMIYPSMFHDVAKYKDQTFFDQHRVIYLETPEMTYVLRPIGMYYISPEEYDVRSVLFKDEQTFQSYLDERLSRPDVIRYEDYDRETLDMLVTLITCSDDGKARQIVECVPEQSYPTSMIPSVIERGEAEIRGEWTEK